MNRWRSSWSGIRLPIRSILSSIIGIVVAGLVFGWAVFCALSIVVMVGLAIYLLVDYLRNRLGR